MTRNYYLKNLLDKLKQVTAAFKKFYILELIHKLHQTLRGEGKD